MRVPSSAHGFWKLIANSANKLGNGQDLLMSAELLDRTQHITCYVMCDDIGESLRDILKFDRIQCLQSDSWDYEICRVEA